MVRITCETRASASLKGSQTDEASGLGVILADEAEVILAADDSTAGRNYRRLLRRKAYGQRRQIIHSSQRSPAHMPSRLTNFGTALFRRQRVPSAVLFAVIALTAAGGIAWASIPDAGTLLIHGCYNTTTGTLRVIDPAKSQVCSASEHALNWNSRGINWRGNWSATAAYAVNDAVSLNGSSYLARVATTNDKPPSTSWWTLASRGATGATGLRGATGPKGNTGPTGPACDPSNPACVGPQGPPGNDGAPGPPGNDGAQGPPGPSDLYSQNADFGPDLTGFTSTTILSLTVPAGSYLVMGRVNVENRDSSAQDATCQISSDNASQQEQQRLVSGTTTNGVHDPGYIGSFKLQDAEVFNVTATIELRCASWSAGTFYARLAALKVGAIH